MHQCTEHFFSFHKLVISLSKQKKHSVTVTNDETSNPGGGDDSILETANAMATSTDRGWKMLKAETALLMITSVHESPALLYSGVTGSQ